MTENLTSKLIRCKTTNSYHKNCIYCQEEFHGRKNKKYCSAQCKINYNNESRRSSINILNQKIRAYRKSATALQNAMKGIKGVRNISLNELKELGFEMSAPFSIYQIKNLSGSWKSIGSFAYKHHESNPNIIYVIRLKNTSDLENNSKVNN